MGFLEGSASRSPPRAKSLALVCHGWRPFRDREVRPSPGGAALEKVATSLAPPVRSASADRRAGRRLASGHGARTVTTALRSALTLGTEGNPNFGDCFVARGLLRRSLLDGLLAVTEGRERPVVSRQRQPGRQRGRERGTPPTDEYVHVHENEYVRSGYFNANGVSRTVTDCRARPPVVALRTEWLRRGDGPKERLRSVS